MVGALQFSAHRNFGLGLRGAVGERAAPRASAGRCLGLGGRQACQAGEVGEGVRAARYVRAEPGACGAERADRSDQALLHRRRGTASPDPGPRGSCRASWGRSGRPRAACGEGVQDSGATEDPRLRPLPCAFPAEPGGSPSRCCGRLQGPRWAARRRGDLGGRGPAVRAVEVRRSPARGSRSGSRGRPRPRPHPPAAWLPGPAPISPGVRPASGRGRGSPRSCRPRPSAPAPMTSPRAGGGGPRGPGTPAPPSAPSAPGSPARHRP